MRFASGILAVNPGVPFFSFSWYEIDDVSHN
jgi:hypothetical protein